MIHCLGSVAGDNLKMMIVLPPIVLDILGWLEVF